MLLLHIILAMLWMLYVVLHSVLASIGVKKKMQFFLGNGYRYYRLGYTVLAFVFLVGILWFQLSMATVHVYEPFLLASIAGSLIAACGLAIMLICIRNYFMGLSGLQSLFKEQAKGRLIISGIHRYVRHPLYLGTFLFLWGLFIVFPYASLLIATTIITTYTLIAIQWEEEKLVAEYGESYRNYQQMVPKLIPKF